MELNSTTPNITEVKEPNSVVRILDSLVAAVVQQSTESDDKTRTFLSYWMSPYALMCMITAVIMNRVVIFASARNQRRLPTHSNIMLRLFALYILFQGSYGLFVSLKATSEHPWIQWLLQSDYFDINPVSLSKHTFLTLPFGRPDSVSTTTYILRNFHLSLCLSQIMDTFISVASGSKPAMETGITLFEYSLAFQEAQFDTKLPIELTTIAFIALANQANVHLLGVFGCIKYKLITSTPIGLFTLAYYGYQLFTLNIFSLPFTIIIGYFPHFCVLTIVLASMAIYVAAGIARASFTDMAMSQVWANWNSVNFGLADDFYVALINFGEFIINVSISQSYVQETGDVLLPRDNYIMNGLKSGYGIEVENHPELRKREVKTGKRKLMIWNRVKMLNGMVGLFFKLIKSNISDCGVEVVNDNDTVVVNHRSIVIDIDDYEDFDEIYPQLLLDTELLEKDGSNDYQDESDLSDDEDQEALYEDDIEEHDDSDDTAIKELITVKDLQHLLIPESAEDLIEHQIMTYHLQHLSDNKRLTRSNFAEYYTDDLKLIDLLVEKKRFSSTDNSTASKPSTKSQIVNDDLGVCVICHENSRQIVLWPCKCLAICEKCRVSLFVREFANCVCCRSKVDGFSKVYIP